MWCDLWKITKEVENNYHHKKRVKSLKKATAVARFLVSDWGIIKSTTA
jgi:hypothetical protein